MNQGTAFGWGVFITMAGIVCRSDVVWAMGVGLMLPHMITRICNRFDR